MPDMEQKTEEYGTTVLKLLRVKSSVAGNVKFYGNIILVIKSLKENDEEMMMVRIVSVANQSNITANINNITASEKLSINKLNAYVNHRSNSIEFGPLQGVCIEENLRGKGIGTFAMNELVKWIKTNFAEYSVNPYDFASNEYINEADKKIRNQFLEDFGFTISYSDITQNSGSIKIKKANMLREHYNADKIEEQDIEKYIFNLIADKSKLEKDYSDVKRNYETRGEELISGIPKSDIIKYTIISCVCALIIMIILIM